MNNVDPDGRERDPLENQKRHKEAVDRLAGQLQKQGYDVQREVKVEVKVGNKTETRMYDLVASKKGDTPDSARYIEVKTFDKNHPKGRVGIVARLVETITRGAVAQQQIKKDQAFMQSGGVVLRSGREAQPSQVEWRSYTHDGKRIVGQAPPVILRPNAEDDE